MSNQLCELCGEPMPLGEEMFRYHGYSGPCPKPPIKKPANSAQAMSEQQQDLRTFPEIVAALRKLGGVFTEFADEINASHKDSEQKTRELISDWRKEAERLKKRKIFNGQRSVYVQCANQLETLLLDLRPKQGGSKG